MKTALAGQTAPPNIAYMFRPVCQGPCRSRGWLSYLRHRRAESRPLDLNEAGASFRLSSGETLAAASMQQPLAVVFLRHFGCTFTRRILRGLETLKTEADRNGARLVLVHMLREGSEAAYLPGDPQAVARIADPECRLYRAFGLGRGGLLELFGPQVWVPMAISLLRGCGMGYPVSDGAQMPGAFLFHQGRVTACQLPRSQAFLPDLARLFDSAAPSAPPLRAIA